MAAHLYGFYLEHDTAAPELFISMLEDRELVKLATSLLMQADDLDRRPGLIDEYIRSIKVFQLEREAKRFELQKIQSGERRDLEGMRAAFDEEMRIKALISTLQNAKTELK